MTRSVYPFCSEATPPNSPPPSVVGRQGSPAADLPFHWGPRSRPRKGPSAPVRCFGRPPLKSYTQHAPQALSPRPSPCFEYHSPTGAWAPSRHSNRHSNRHLRYRVDTFDAIDAVKHQRRGAEVVPQPVGRPADDEKPKGTGSCTLNWISFKWYLRRSLTPVQCGPGITWRLVSPSAKNEDQS